MHSPIRTPRWCGAKTGSGRIRRRIVATVGCALLSVNLSGCNWLPTRQEVLTPIQPNLSQTDLIEHLNANIRQLHSWSCLDAQVSTKTPMLPVKLSLSAIIAVERQRNFRLRASVLGSEEADFGSNDEQFWFWIRRGDPYLFTARHEHLPAVSERLPIPFQPDWIMEALGVREIDPSKIKLQQPGPSPNIVNFVLEESLASGQKIRRELQVDRNLGIVLGHSLYDGAANLVAKASLSDHRREPSGVIMPHRVDLEFPLTQMELTIELKEINVNPSHLPASMWELPHLPNVRQYDMGEHLARTNPTYSGGGVQQMQGEQFAEAPPFAVPDAPLERPPFAQPTDPPAAGASPSTGPGWQPSANAPQARPPADSLRLHIPAQ
ncbi:hypothetical protein [Thalassoroseus pseudoceratinae]|uniref:hypothetical protein n=1 Tax=Thalassoroseus pseudoceratinae TaxID=2713176 RepID=UPI00141DD979|nr:hypothetical protein [Thalassoroseus pseudoceratinae]